MPLAKGRPVGAVVFCKKTPPSPYAKQMAMKIIKATALMPLSHSWDLPAMTTPN